MYMDGQNQLDFHVHTNINRKSKDIAAGGPQVLDLSQTQSNVSFCRGLSLKWI